MKSLYICLFSNFVVIKITRVLSQLKNHYYHNRHLWYISKIVFKHIIFLQKYIKPLFLMDCSTFKNHGNSLFLLKNQHMTIYGSRF
jgi:hypothetical protein